MSDAATQSVSKNRSPMTWFAVSLVAALCGAVAAWVYTVTWFPHIAGGCGVVRGYEQLLGIVILGGWFAGCAVGIGLATYGCRKNSKAGIAGAIIAIIISSGMVFVCTKTIHDIHEAKFFLKSTERLLQLVAGSDMGDRQHAAHELGRRRAVEAVPALCAILDDGEEYINLRHNAAIALGKICAPPHPSQSAVAQAVKSLTKATEGEDESLADFAKKSLSRIGVSKIPDSTRRRKD